MRGIVVFALGLSLLGCVPASEKLPPAGAAGFVTEPSAGARGEPFTTDDGWTVRFDKVILQATVSVQPSDDESFYYGGEDAYRWNGATRVEVFARGVKVGPSRVWATLDGSFLSLEFTNDHESIVNLGISKEDSARFSQAPDGGFGPYSFGGGPGPNLLLAVRAEKDGQVVTFDLALSAFRSSPFDDDAFTPVVVVRADAVVFVPLGVEPERIFANQADGTQLAFDPIARADADGDGRVTADELVAAPPLARSRPPGYPDVDEDYPVSSDPQGLLGTLIGRGSSILVGR